MRRLVFLLVLTAAGALGVTVVALRPAAQESEAPQASKVGEHEMQTFIAVYSAMQLDHDLQIEQAIEPYQMSLDDFRQLERRVQAEQHLVDRVRQALQTQAQSRSLFAQAPTPTPARLAPTKTPATPRRRKK